MSLELEISMTRDANVKLLLGKLAAALIDAQPPDWTGETTFTIVKHKHGVRVVAVEKEEVTIS